MASGESLDARRLLEIIEIQRRIATTDLDLDAVMDVVAREAEHLTGADAAVVELAEGEQMVYRAATGSAREHLGLRLDIVDSLSGRAVIEGEVLRCDDSETDPRVDHAAAREVGAISMVCVPLRHGDSIAGVLKVLAGEPGRFDDDDVAVLGLLSGLIATRMAEAAWRSRVDAGAPPSGAQGDAGAG